MDSQRAIMAAAVDAILDDDPESASHLLAKLDGRSLRQLATGCQFLARLCQDTVLNRLMFWREETAP